MVSAQTSSALRFSYDTYDYGHIAEDGGSVRCSFEATNLGSKPIDIERIVTTCGCTSAHYESSRVAPGERFRFDVSYDPMNRPGRIDRQIIVDVSDSERDIVLHIIGFVQARERTIEELYPFDMGGGLRLTSNFHAFGYVEHGKSISEQIACINNSEQSITLTPSSHTSSGALNVTLPATLAPHATADITFEYALSDDSDTYGTLTDRVYIMVNGAESRYTIDTQVIVTDNFDIIDDISAPRADIPKNIIKFGDVKVSDGVLERSTTITNIGASPLVIRCVESTTTAVECLLLKGTTLLPGESAEVRVRLYAERIEDVDNPLVARIRLITNDPVRPMQTLRVNAIPTF